MTTLTRPATVLARVRQARRRFVRALALEWAGRAAILAASAMLAAGVARWLLGVPPIDVGLWLAGLGAWIGITVWGIVTRLPSDAATAAALDAVASTRNRFATALELSVREPRTRFVELAMRECEEYAASFSVEGWIPLHAPRFAAWALAPLFALAVLQIAHQRVVDPRRPDGANVARATEAAESLNQLAAIVGKAADERKDERLAALAEQMRLRAERLKERAPKDRDADQQALREMNSLEEMLRQMQAEAGKPAASAEELAALAEALARQASTRDVAETIRKGDVAGAGRQLEELLRRMQQRGDVERQLDEIARSLQEPAAKLTETQKNEVAREMQQAAQAAQAGQSEKMQQLLQRLAKLLQQRQNQSPTKPAGTSGPDARTAEAPLTERQLEDLIKALERMKQGDGKGALDAAQRGLARIPLPRLEEIRGEGKGKAPPGAEGDLPAGNPGGGKDAGASEKLFAEKSAAVRDAEGPARKLEGVLGDGASLQEFMQSSGTGGKSGRAYRELYEAMAPAAQDSVEQENIPLGSRATVKRYFESIRPAE